MSTIFEGTLRAAAAAAACCRAVCKFSSEWVCHRYQLPFHFLN